MFFWVYFSGTMRKWLLSVSQSAVDISHLNQCSLYTCHQRSGLTSLLWEEEPTRWTLQRTTHGSWASLSGWDCNGTGREHVLGNLVRGTHFHSLFQWWLPSSLTLVLFSVSKPDSNCLPRLRSLTLVQQNSPSVNVLRCFVCRRCRRCIVCLRASVHACVCLQSQSHLCLVLVFYEVFYSILWSTH